MIKKWLRRLYAYLEKVTFPSQHETVMMLITNTPTLELARGEWVDFAPVRGCCGPIKLRGGLLPEVEYLLFDKKTYMQFVRITVHVYRPDRVEYRCVLQSTDLSIHEQEVPLKDEYQEAFHLFSRHLFRYFPFTRAEQWIHPTAIRCLPQELTQLITEPKMENSHVDQNVLSGSQA